MQTPMFDRSYEDADRATICRISAEGTRWRVQVESWPVAQDEVSGRFVFEPETRYATRASGPALRARRREEVFAAAHEMPEERLRELLHSLS